MKQIKTFVLLCVFILATCAGAWATDAKVEFYEGTTKRYEGGSDDFTKALASVDKDVAHTIVLLEDAKASGIFQLSSDLIIDGNGHTLIAESDFGFVVSHDESHDLRGRTVTIKNLTIKGSGNTTASTSSGLLRPFTLSGDIKGILSEVKIEKFGRTAVVARGKADLTIESCDITGDYTKDKDNCLQNGIYAADATVTIRGTTVKGMGSTYAAKDSDTAGAVVLGYYQYPDGSGSDYATRRATVTIESGHFEGEYGALVYNEGNGNKNNIGTLVIKGGEFKGEEADFLIQSSDVRGISVATLQIIGGKYSKTYPDPYVLYGYKTNPTTGEYAYEVVAEGSGSNDNNGSGSGDGDSNSGTDGNEPTADGEANATVDEGVVKVEVEAGKEASLETVIEAIAEAISASGADSVETVELPKETAGSTLTSEGLQKLAAALKTAGVTDATVDLGETSGYPNNAVDLSGVELPSLKVSNVDAAELKLDATTNITKIDASGNDNIKTVDLAGNGNIEDFTATSASITNINLEGCEKLKNLDVEGNSLLFTDVSSLSSLEEAKLGGQTSDRPLSSYRSENSINFLGLMQDFLAELRDQDAATKSAKIIDNISEVSDGTQTAVIVRGVATFPTAPGESIKYKYNPVNSILSALPSDAKVSEMDVTLTNTGTSTPDPDPNPTPAMGGSGGGCEVGFGLWALAALVAVACKKR